MRGALRRLRAALPALTLCCGVLSQLSGCTLYNSIFHRAHDHGCSEKPFSSNTQNLPGLAVPPGMTPPDTRNQVKIPTLDEPERARARNEPCLDQPPSYATGTSIAVPARARPPMGQAPLPPAPAPPTVPAAPPQQ
ncbi:MAG TPA: hypothetical protein VIX87_09945 [Steroidobacteraceae bacterium]